MAFFQNSIIYEREFGVKSTTKAFLFDFMKKLPYEKNTWEPF